MVEFRNYRALRELVAEELSMPLMGEGVATQAEEVAQRMTELWMDLPTASGDGPPPRELSGIVTIIASPLEHHLMLAEQTILFSEVTKAYQ